MNEKNVQFKFPSFNEDLQMVLSLLQLRERLQAIIDISDVDKINLKYSYQQPNMNYIYAKCRFSKCSACLRYKKKEGPYFELTMFRSNHNHLPQKYKKYRLKAVESCIAKLPAMCSASTIKRLVCQEFHINQKSFYYLWKKIKHPPLAFEDLIKKLQNKGYQIHYRLNQDTNQLPEVFVAVNQAMKNNFLKYGDIISFDLTFNLIKNIHQSGEKYKVGCFVGISNVKRITPFGFVVTLHTKQQDYCEIFTTFFKIMGKEPSVIVTDQERSIQSALTQLKKNNQFSGEHLLDTYHILHNIRKKLSKKQHIKYFKTLIHARNKPEFDNLKAQATTKLLPNELPLMDQFLRSASRYCFAILPQLFIGFTSTSTTNEKLHDLWKCIQPSQKAFQTTVDQLTQKLEQLGGKCQRAQLSHIPYQDLYFLPELKIIRSVLSKNVLDKFIEELAKSIRCDVSQIYGATALVKDLHAIFTIKLEVGNKWNCECGYQQKSGLPCSHLLKLLIAKEIPIFSSIHPRWIIAEQITLNKQHQGVRRGRERLSRRN